MNVARSERLAQARWQARRHAAVRADALLQWQGVAGAELAAVESDPTLRPLTVQILFRFMTLQDAIGERLDRLEKPGFQAWGIQAAPQPA